MTEIIYNITASAGREIVLSGLTNELGKDNILGIINKTTGKVLYTPTKYSHMAAAYSNGTLTITLDSTVEALGAGDQVFVKGYLDADLGITAILEALAQMSIPTVAQIQNGLAKTSELLTIKSALQGNDQTATLTAILAALQSSEEEIPEELPAGLADRVMLLLDFFGITEATEYQALTPAEAIAIARDCQYNVMGTDWPIPTWLPTGVTESQVESAAEGLGIPYHEPTQTA